MLSKSKLWLVAIVFFCIVARLLGDTAAVWLKGGEQGWVNIPMCAQAGSVAVTAKYDYGYKMASVDTGAHLELPSNMRTCTVTHVYSGVKVSTKTATNNIKISGKDLELLREGGITRFEMILADGLGRRIDLLFTLSSSSKSYEIFIKCN